jgi:hypothetical protein
MDIPRIDYEPVTDPAERTWREHATVHVVGYASPWVVYAGVSPAQRYAITELRIFPMEGSLPQDGVMVPVAGAASAVGEWSGRADRVPAGGIPTDLLRAINVSDIRAAARAWVIAHGITTGGSDATWQAVSAAVLRHNAMDAHRELTPDEKLALLAAEYVELLDDPATRPRVNEELAQRHDRAAGWVSTQVYRARQRELLDPKKPGRGKPEGRLTARAKDLLDHLYEETNR